MIEHGAQTMGEWEEERLSVVHANYAILKRTLLFILR